MLWAVRRWLVFPVGCVSMAVPDDSFIKRLKHVARFGQRKVIVWKYSCDWGSICVSVTAVLVRLRVHLCVCYSSTGQTEGPSVCLLQQYWSDWGPICVSVTAVLVRLRVHLCVCYNSTCQTSSEYFLVYVFLCFIKKSKFVWLVINTTLWNNDLGVYATFSIHRN
jgi:hypothetical protein